MNGYLAGGLGAGIAAATDTIRKGQTSAYNIQERRRLQALAEQRQKEIDAQNNLKFEQDTQQTDLAIQTLQMQLKQMRDKQTKQDTYNSFEAYRQSGDIKYLNELLKNPDTRKYMGGANGIYKVDLNSADDVAMLKNLGLTDEQIHSEHFDPNRYVKTTRDGGQPGKYDIVDLYGVYGRTGYMNKIKDQDIKELTYRAKQFDATKKQSEAVAAQLKTEHMINWLRNNPDKTVKDYENLGKQTQAGLKSTSASGIVSIVDKYRDKLFDGTTKIDSSDISKAQEYAIQAGIKPDAKSNRELKDSFNTLKLGKVLLKKVNALKDEQLARGLTDVGIQKIKTLFSDKKFSELSKEEQLRTLANVDMNTRLGMFLADYIKSMSGLAVSDHEYAKLKDLFMGDAFENTQKLKASVNAFVDTLDSKFKNSLQTSLIDNPVTTLDLARKYQKAYGKQQEPEKVDDYIQNNRQLIDTIKKYETFKSEPYSDYKQTSIGYGTKANGRKSITEQEAEKDLVEHIKKVDSKVSKFIPEDTPKGIKDALVSLSYNTGTAWMSAGLGKAIKAKDWKDAKTRFLQYVKAGGKVLPGLVKRRKDEAKAFDEVLGAANSGKSNDYQAKVAKYQSLIGKVNPATGKKLVGFEQTPPYNPIWEDAR